MHKKNESWECTNYWSISLLDLPGKMYAIYLEKRCHEMTEPTLEDTEWSFHAGRKTTD